MIEKVEVSNPNWKKDEISEAKKLASYKKNREKRKRLKRSKRKN